MDRRALKFSPLQPGDRVSVPRPGNKGGREIAEFLFFDPDSPEEMPEVIVRRPNGKLKRWQLIRVHLYIDEKYRREIRQLEADLEEEDARNGVPENDNV